MSYVCGECGEKFERAGYCARDGHPVVETDDSVIGTEIGRYRVARLLAEGGMGRVYLGVQPTIGSRVAIKILGDQSKSSDLLDRFFAEARAVNMIRHENIVSVIDLAKLDDGRPYIVMEYIEGQTLASLVRTGGAPLGGVVQVMMEVLSALAAAHAIGIVHRDLKPDNVLVTGEGHAKVLDFGIAKLMPGLSQQLSPRTRTGALLGTPAYMAPEQITASGHIDARTDIYAAGIVLFEATTGRVPFAGETLFDLMRQHLEVAPQSPRAFRPEIPVAIENVILQALAKDPAHRFQTANAMAQALQHGATELRPDDWRSLSTRRTPITGGGQVTSATRMRFQNAPTPRTNPPAVAPKRPEPKKSMLPWIAGAAAAIAAAVLVTALAVRRKPAAKRDEVVAGSPSPTPSATTSPTAPPADAAVAEQHDGVVMQDVQIIPTNNTKQLSTPADYDAKNFDPVVYIPKATALAQKLYPDAKLTRFEFDPVYSDGHVDLTEEGRDREYYFRSEAASKRPAGVPRNKPVERPCMIHVDLEAKSITARVVSDDDCDDKFVRIPKCTFAGVWKQAKKTAKVPDDFIARIAWLEDEKWFFDTDLGQHGTGGVSSFEDRCP